MGWKTAGLIRVSGLTDGTDVDVLEAIASFLNEEDGRCFPALESVMLVARKSRNIVRQSIKTLCVQGLLSFSAEPGKVRSYVIHVHNLPEPKLDCFKEFFRTELCKKGPQVQKLTGFRSEPGSEVNREGVQKCTPTGFRSEPGGGSEMNPEQGNEQVSNREQNKEVMCAPSGNSSAIAAVASAQAQTLPTSFPQSSNSQNHSETQTAGKDSLPNASERSVAAHRDRLDASDGQTLQNGTRRSQNASTCISVACPENEPPPMSDEDLENLFANAQLEECPPFPEKGVRPPFEKGEHPFSEKEEKGTHPSEQRTERPKKKRTSIARPDGVSEQVWNDFSALRNKRRAPITETALKGIQREAEKAGISLEAALSTCCERGWQGFKAEWYSRATAKSSSPAPSSGGRYLTAQERYEERMRKAGEMSDAEYMAQFLRPTPLEIEARQRKNHESA